VRQTIVFVTLLVLLGILGFSLVVGASNTRAAARLLLEQGATPTPSASAAAVSARAVASTPPAAPSGSASPEAKPPVDRSLSVAGLGWELLAPALLAADGLKSTATSDFAKADVKVSISVAGTMTDIERALATGGAGSGGADLALLPLSELASAYERLRVLDLRVLLVTGWSQGRDVLTGTAFSKLPAAGSIGVEYDGGADALSLTLLTLDLAGIQLERLKIDERSANALLHAKSGGADEASKQEDLQVSTREATRLLPYVLVAPRPLLEDRELVLAAFVQGWLSGVDTLLKDRAKAARTLAAIDGAPEALSLLQSLGSWEPIRLYDSAALLGLSGRGAISIESLIDWQLRARRAARLGRASAPDVSLVDGRVVTRLVREQPKLLRPSELPKRRASAAGAGALLERAFHKDDEESLIEAVGVLAAVFPRHDVRLTARTAKASAQWLDRAAARYDIERARLLSGNAPTPGRAALLEVLRTP
jgi:hypothetical protein